MKHLKVTSVVLTIAICMSMFMPTVSVLADEASAPSETQSTEETEIQKPKETEKPAPKETEKKETEPSEKKEAESTEKPAVQEPAETDKQLPAETEKTEPAETKEQERDNRQHDQYIIRLCACSHLFFLAKRIQETDTWRQKSQGQGTHQAREY